MAEALIKLKEAGFNRPVCVGVHGVFAGSALPRHTPAGAEVITTNSIPGDTDMIDVSELFASALK